MTDRDALLAGIVANPDDDLPRLVFADWLEEHGDPGRAEFVRLQCDHFRRFPVPTWVPGDGATIRMFELEKKHARRWLGEMPRVEGVTWGGFYRGFPGVEVVWGGWPGLVAVRNTAPVERLTIRNLDIPEVARLAGSPLLARVRVLAVRPFDSNVRGLPALFASPGLAGVRVLDLSQSGAGDDGAEAVAACPYLGGLKLLRLDRAGVGDRGAFALTQSPHLPPGLRVELDDDRIDDPATLFALDARFPGWST